MENITRTQASILERLAKIEDFIKSNRNIFSEYFFLKTALGFPSLANPAGQNPSTASLSSIVGSNTIVNNASAPNPPSVNQHLHEDQLVHNINHLETPLSHQATPISHPTTTVSHQTTTPVSHQVTPMSHQTTMQSVK